jgi:adenosine deaminase
MQVPRLYNVYKAQGLLENFEQMLYNLFQPLFEVTADPTTHPQLHIFLQQVRGSSSQWCMCALSRTCCFPCALASAHAPL